VIELHYGGSVYSVRFDQFSPSVATILKHVLVEQLSREVTAITIVNRIMGARNFSGCDMTSVVLSNPEKIYPLWIQIVSKYRAARSLSVIKGILRVLCNYRVGGWSPSYSEYISKSLSLPGKDKYAFLRSGKAFFSIEQESKLVQHIDDTTQSITADQIKWRYRDLADVGMLVCALQFGMRPMQIARLKINGVHHRIFASDGSSAVHLAFPMAKQRRGTQAVPLVRRVKPEWASVFVELLDRSTKAGTPGTSRIFDVSSASEVGARISRVARGLLHDDVVSAKTFRHSAAQRMVDAGASHEELAAFLGHSNITSSLVYFETSSSHADRINRALGISKVYSKLAKVAHDRFITEEDLAELKGDHQIGGAPHGIPIAGIGGCRSGQPTCPYNPVLSCYGCRRFMPLQNPSVHREVLADLRKVVGFFSASSREETSTPALLQLQRTIVNVQSIVGELEGGWHE
jgi:integrase